MGFVLDFGGNAPLPPLFVSVPGTALDGLYGPSAASLAAAVANNSRSGWWLASMTRTRRVLRRIAAPILSSRTRMVAALARSSSRGLQRQRAQPLHQRVGQCGQQQPELVGDEARATGAGAEQIELGFLDAVLGLAALAVQMRRTAAWHRRAGW